MSAILLNDTDILRLSARVNVQRAAGLIPTGGLLANKGTYFQMMVTGESAVTYTVVMEASDEDFQAKANILSGLGAFALGTPQYISGYWVQAFGDMAGSGGGGTELPDGTEAGQALVWDGSAWVAGATVLPELPDGTTSGYLLTWNGTEWVAAAPPAALPDGTLVNQTIFWDGDSWEPGIVPAKRSIYTEGSKLGANMPAIDISTAAGFVAGYLVIDVTGQTLMGIQILNGTTPVIQLSGGAGAWSLVGPAGTGAVNGTTSQTQLSAPSVTNIALSPTSIRFSGASSTLVDLVAASLQPFTTNTVDLGASNKRWRDIYLQNAPNVSSDSRVKTAPQAIPDAVLDAVGDVDLVQYKMLAAIAEKGEANARYHFGVIAQQLIDAFAAHGLDATDWGVLCHDSWDAQPPALDDDGNEIAPGFPAGDGYSIRYEELLVLEAARVRRELSRLSS